MHLRSISAIALCAILINGCKKDDDQAPPSGGGGGGTPVPSDGLVASWSPVKPYADDVITLTGGPFSTTASQNTVDAWGGIFTVVSVSETELVVHPPANMEDIIPVGGYTSLIVQSGSNTDTIPYLFWKRPMDVYHMVDNLSENVFGQPCRVGDSVLFAGSGFTTDGLGVLVAGSSVDMPTTVDSAYHCEASLRIPPDVFGYQEDESLVENHDITIVNSDGRMATLNLPIGVAPKSTVTSFGTPVCCYSIAEMQTNGTVVNIELFGRNLKQCNTATLYGPVTLPLPLPAAYSDHVSWVLTPGNLVPGSYSMTLLTCSGGPLSTAYFTVNP